MDIAQQWGLPPEFVPVRYAISDDAKNALRGVLQAGEPVIVSIANEGDTVSIVATPQRLFTVKTAQYGAGAAGASVKEFPWAGIFDIVMTPMTLNLKIAVHYRSNDGRKAEVGRRAMLAKPAVENLMPFELVGGEEVFRALLQIWNSRRAETQNAP
ncbi:MAG: hypothetical protein KY445_01985 [Armatimonadetes bacterium]|nr:hypothetical protein [Armatimonadota bacterium]